MRTALLSARVKTQDDILLAIISIADMSVLEHQCKAAMGLGCERIVCLCDEPDRDLQAVLKKVEKREIDIHVISGPTQLVSLLDADDDLIIFGEGLIPRHLRKDDFVVGNQSLILTSSNFRTNYERIDAERRWAGFMSIRARIAFDLANLPPDVDVVSMLLRLALQGNVELFPISNLEPRLSRWFVVEDFDDAERAEREIASAQSEPISWTDLSGRLSSEILHRISPGDLSKTVRSSLVLSMGLLASAMLCAVSGNFSIALSIAALAAFAMRICTSASRRRQDIMADWNIDPFRMPRYAPDLSSIVILVLSVEPDLQARLLAFLAVGSASVAARLTSSTLGPFWNDRPVHLAIFAICAANGSLTDSLAIFAAIGLSLAMFETLNASSRSDDCTRPNV